MLNKFVSIENEINKKHVFCDFKIENYLHTIAKKCSSTISLTSFCNACNILYYLESKRLITAIVSNSLSNLGWVFAMYS